MFDILPSSAVPSDVKISEAIKAAKEACREQFRKLPPSLERESLLNALGRVGKASLKHKIRHRAKTVISRLGHKYSEITSVTDEAVNCRNHYVHGDDPRFDYYKHSGMPLFFTDTLEFVFATSDLIEAGWDARAWAKRYSFGSHPFAYYHQTYEDRLQELKSLLPPSR